MRRGVRSLRRDFQAMIDRENCGSEIGKSLLELSGQLSWGFAPRRPRRESMGPGVSDAAFPVPLLHRRQQDFSRFWGSLSAFALLYDPGRTDAP